MTAPRTGRFATRAAALAALALLCLCGAGRADEDDDSGVPITAATPDGAVVLSWQGFKGPLRLLDGREKKPAWREVPTGLSLPSCVSVTPDGRHAVVADGNLASVLALSPKAKVLRVVKPEDGASEAAVSPDGKVVAVSAVLTNVVALYDVGTGKRGHVLMQGRRALEEFPVGLCFTPDGKSLLVGTVLAHRRLMFSVETGKMLWEAKDRFGASAFAFSPDKKTAAAGGRDGNVRLFDLGSGKALAEFRAGKARTDDIAFSADGKRVAALTGDGGLAVWDVDKGKFVAEARREGWHGCVRFEKNGKLTLLKNRQRLTFDPVTGRFSEPEEF